MFLSITVVVSEDSIEVIVADPASYHQEGTVNMPARPIIPDESRGLPETWEQAIQDAGQQVMEEEWG